MTTTQARRDRGSAASHPGWARRAARAPGLRPPQQSTGRRRAPARSKTAPLSAARTSGCAATADARTLRKTLLSRDRVGLRGLVHGEDPIAKTSRSSIVKSPALSAGSSGHQSESVLLYKAGSASSRPNKTSESLVHYGKRRVHARCATPESHRCGLVRLARRESGNHSSIPVAHRRLCILELRADNAAVGTGSDTLGHH